MLEKDEKKRKNDDDLIEGQATKKLKKADFADFIEAVTKNNIETVGCFLDDSDIDPADKHNLALRIACEKGHLEMVRLLLKDPRVYPMQEVENLDDSDDEEVIDPLILACKYGHVGIVKLLLADLRVIPSEYNNQAAQNAISSGFAEIVELLMEDSRIDLSLGELLFFAVQAGNNEIVKILLADSRISLSLNPNNLSECKHSSLSELCQVAADHDYLDVLELLLSHSEDPPHLKATDSLDPHTHIKFALNCNGLFFESLNKLESKLSQITAKNLGEEIAKAYKNSI
ncbi:MAG: ankyrin repeat domain-containing protein [Tatlockia sp.]|nr:ankyrin repeat domain-containing protein [Tatlockia sp.]